MIRFLGDETGAAPLNAGSKGPLLLLSDIEQDCLNWLTDTADSGQDSIPLALFKDGYDVWMGCRRGTAYSRVTNNDIDVSGAAEEQPFFNYNTVNVGEEDVPRMISKILFEKKNESSGADCQKVQILLNGYAMSETLAAMAKYPTDALARIQNIVALAPCAIPTAFASEASDARILSDKTPPRELASLLDADQASKGRKLSVHGPSNYYWNVTLYNWCWHNHPACFNYCDWYPEYCD